MTFSLTINELLKCPSHTVQTIEKFESIWAVPELRKTQTIWLGSKTNCKVKYMPHLNIIWNANKFQILGVWLSTNLKESEFLNYDEKTIKVIFFV